MKRIRQFLVSLLIIMGVFSSSSAQIIPNGDFEDVFVDTMYFEPVGYSQGYWSSTSVFDYPLKKYGSVHPKNTGNNTVLEIEKVIDSPSFFGYKIAKQSFSAGNYSFSCDAQTISSKQDSGKIYILFADNNNNVVGGTAIKVPSSSQNMANYSATITVLSTANVLYIGMEGGDSSGTIFHVDNLSLKDPNNKVVTIPNGDFESWNPVIRRMPTHWVSSFPGIAYKEDTIINQLNNDTITIPIASISYPAAESEGTIAHSGQKSLKIVPAMVMTGENMAFGASVLGAFGVDFNPVFYSVATTDTLDSLIAYINMNPGNTSQLSQDSVMIIVKLKNANKQQDFYKKLSLADLTANQFNKIVIDLTAFGETPDSIGIGFYIGHATTTDKFYSPGFPTIYVDNVRFYIKGFAASVKDLIPYLSDITLYQAGEFLSVRNLPNSVRTASLHLYDLSGKLLYQTNISNKIPKPDVPAGLYLYEIKDNHKTLKVGKIFLD